MKVQNLLIVLRPYLSKSVQKRWPVAAAKVILNKNGCVVSSALQIPLVTGVFYLFSIRPYYVSTITRRHLILDENNKLKLVEMNLPNDITFTYAYLIENYGSLTLKALGGGVVFHLPQYGLWLITSEVEELFH